MVRSRYGNGGGGGSGPYGGDNIPLTAPTDDYSDYSDDTDSTSGSSSSSSSLQHTPRSSEEYRDYALNSGGDAGRPPRKAICLALALLLSGIALLTLGLMLVTGLIDSDYWKRGFILLLVGALVFLPGFFVSRIALYSYLGYRGFSYQDIPEFYAD
eukprot:TRINITY_DN7256_c0_g1_i1.p1 TRINITY_DN7256_c0_g1~~TRINITY_DN7256_c0_g1_i1.p1  ORF type:complete len:156 (+),score=31.70 TRINITY_DN7256_c0_g1_i1:48-515(+)